MEPEGVTWFETEGGPVPTALVALTLKVYEVPFFNPVTVVLGELAFRPVQLAQAGLGVTLYEMIDPPLEVGAVH
jgi:hypothetical protein